MHTPLQSLWLSFLTALHDEGNYCEAKEQILPPDDEIRRGIEFFLTCDKNREAVGRLDFNGFEDDGLIIIGTQHHKIKKNYQQFCTNEVKFRALWLLLVRLCNSLLPMENQFLKQQEWLEGAVRGQVQPAVNQCKPVHRCSMWLQLLMLCQVTLVVQCRF